MDALKAALANARKRKPSTQKGGVAKKKKYVRRGDLERQREEKYLEEQKLLEEKRKEVRNWLITSNFKSYHHSARSKQIGKVAKEN